MDPADFYTGLVADLYAPLKGSSQTAEPYARFIAGSGEPALELGCGDGEPLLDLVAQGLDVDGVDSSPDMLTRARARAVDRGLTVDLVAQRMEDLELPRRYRSIFLAGPTFTLLPDDATALRALQAIRAHLTDDGTALVPLWTPPPTPADQLGRVRESRSDDGVVLRFVALSEQYDAAVRTRATRVRYEREIAAGVEVENRTWVLHWHTRAGFADLAQQAGLRVLAVRDPHGGPDRPDAAAWHVVVGRDDVV